MVFLKRLGTWDLDCVVVASISNCTKCLITPHPLGEKVSGYIIRNLLPFPAPFLYFRFSLELC
jgi:hypothetical protein